MKSLYQFFIFQSQIDSYFKSFINFLITVEMSCRSLLFSQLFYSRYHKNDILTLELQCQKIEYRFSIESHIKATEKANNKHMQ